MKIQETIISSHNGSEHTILFFEVIVRKPINAELHRVISEKLVKFIEEMPQQEIDKYLNK